MRSWTLHRRGLRHYWPVHLATAFCAAAAAAALTGSLLVGDSMRASLCEQAVRRLGPVDHALMSPKFFREALASDLSGGDQFKTRFADACPVILARGAVERADASARRGHVNVLGVDERLGLDLSPAPGSVILNETLARDLGTRTGDDVLLRLGAHQAAPTETLLGRADQATISLRLTVARIMPPDGLGGLDLNPTSDPPRNAFVPLADLQRAIKRPGRVNAILVLRPRAEGKKISSDNADTSSLQESLASRMTLADYGLHLRQPPHASCVILESDSLLIEPAIETAALAAAEQIHSPAVPVLTYLANTIATVPPASQPAREIPYSTVTAISPSDHATPLALTLTNGHPAPPLYNHEILLDEWAAEDLQIAAGDQIRMTWYAPKAFRRLETDNAAFTVRGIVRMSGLAADPTLAPEYPGITDAKRLGDWDPPFPLDLGRIRDRDESYWEQHGPTPKVFVALATGQELWTRTQERFGRLTSIRLEPAPSQDLSATAIDFQRELLHRLTPQAAGLAFEPLQARAQAASRGSTDFGTLFLAFSAFLIASAAMLTALLFRLGVQRRSAQIGLLLAVGFRPRAVARHLLLEAAWPAMLGSGLGLLGALGYSALMLAGLRAWWSGAIDAGFLHLHARPATLLTGWTASLVIALLSMTWSIRGLARRSAHELMLGAPEEPPGLRLPWLSGLIALAALVVALLLIAFSAAKRIPPMPAFFGGGTLLLIASLAALRFWTRRPRRGVIRSGGLTGMASLGIRNAARNPARTLLTAGLIASATFIITAVGAGRPQLDASTAKTSGSGGFTLLAESAVPIVADLNSPDGRRALALSSATQAALDACHVFPLRLRPGDEASCAGLYRPTQPRILGAPRTMIERGGFSFRSSLARTAEQKANPWLLLNEPLPAGVLPAIGDDSTVTWLLHLGLGDDLTITDQHNQPLRLRIVALLSGSVLQSELIVPESGFVEHFPAIGGYSFFLLESPPYVAARLKGLLEADLNRYGLEVTPTAARLARYLAVENAYLTAFQTLGGLGMILGTLGLGAVLWRNVLDRRGELALLAALGYRTANLRWMVLAEHTVVLVWGLAAGATSALLAIAPQIAAHAHNIPWASLGATLLAVLLVGTSAGAVALIPALHGRLSASLRND